MHNLPRFILISLLLIPPSAYAAAHKPTAEDMVLHAIKIKMTEAPKDQETCFSPDEACDIKLLKFMESAKLSIDVAIYDINLPEIVNELVEQSKIMPVRIIVDKRQSKGKHSLVPLMIRQGLNVRYGHQKGIQHDKFTIIDGRMVEAGSFNYTRHASEANNENQIYNANGEVVAHYREQFDKMWERATPAKPGTKLTDAPAVHF